MLKVIDRIFGCLLVLGSVGHTIGTLMWTQPMSEIFIWSLGSSLAAALLGTLNIVRAGRPQDKTLAAITLLGTACWVLVAFAFGKSIGNLPEPCNHLGGSRNLQLNYTSPQTWPGTGIGILDLASLRGFQLADPDVAVAHRMVMVLEP